MLFFLSESTVALRIGSVWSHLLFVGICKPCCFLQQRRRSAMERAYNAPHFHDLPADILSELDHDNTLDLSSKRLRSQSEEASLEKMKTRLRDTESELERVRNELGEARKQLAVTERCAFCFDIQFSDSFFSSSIFCPSFHSPCGCIHRLL